MPIQEFYYKYRDKDRLVRGRFVKQKEKWVKIVCDECGCDYHMRFQSLRDDGLCLCLACSCKGKYRKPTPKGSEHPNFKHGLSSHGYKRIRVNGQMVYEHMVVAEQKLGRALISGEVVHHIDFNKLNNLPSNLAILASREDHEISNSSAESVGASLLGRLVWFDRSLNRYVLNPVSWNVNYTVEDMPTRTPWQGNPKKYYVRRIDGRKKFLHVHIVESIIGRPLTRSECVHHIDLNKKYNDPSNLSLVTLSEHRKAHRSLQYCIGELYKLGIVGFKNGKYFMESENEFALSYAGVWLGSG